MITPEQAQELLDGDFETETHPEWVGVVQADFDSFSGAYIRATPGHEALYEAASDLAHTVANMHYEYDYEVQFGVHWTPQGYEFATAEDTRRVVARRRRAAPARIVRRLVGVPEVVE